MGLLLFALRKKLGKLELESLRKNLPPLALMTIFAGLVAWEGWRLWENSLGHGDMALKIGAVFLPAGVAGLVYWLAALALKIPAAKEMADFALARFKR
jgi:peptidoglycan biosynthesis protein MviN/MurJ (putative lipid II flippase)